MMGDQDHVDNTMAVIGLIVLAVVGTGVGLMALALWLWLFQ